MIIDTHCHFDMDQNPEKYISNNERQRIITIGMTNLPSHFQMGMNHVKKYKYIRLALGLHPLLADDHAKEYAKFKIYVDETSYIGEVGLDFSREAYKTKDVQIKSFEFVLDCVKAKKKILSLHSRRAEKEVLEMLVGSNVKNAIFHWYSGSLKSLDSIIDEGYYFSINSAMIQSDNGKKIISKIPKELILTETDSPYINNSSITNVHSYLSQLWDVSNEEIEKIIYANFNRILQKIM